MTLYPASKYVRELRAVLPADAFARAPSRLIWLAVHVAVVSAVIAAFALGRVPWLLAPVASLIIGTCFAGMAFVGHEAMHGALVRGRRVRHVIGWLSFMPYLLSPGLWAAWHNRQHHGNTNRVDVDPDMYPVLGAYEDSVVVRAFTDHFALGGRRWTGVVSLLVGFTGQSSQILVTARSTGLLTARQFRVVLFETGLAVLVWLAVAFLVGPLAFLFVFVLPLVIGNVWVMAFILTNHGLSPHAEVNDPLYNSLSVTVPRVVDWFTLGFGYHVEHHVFPAMSTRHAPLVRDELRRRWPERYQSMPILTALGRLHDTARIYADNVTLVDPQSGQRWPTLLPRTEPTPITG